MAALTAAILAGTLFQAGSQIASGRKAAKQARQANAEQQAAIATQAQQAKDLSALEQATTKRANDAALLMRKQASAAGRNSTFLTSSTPGGATFGDTRGQRSTLLGL